MVDFILNGQASGNVGATLLQNNMDPRALRPWIGKNGRSYRSVVGNNGIARAVPLVNANATLRKDEWKILDDAIVKAARQRLRAVADLRERGLQFTIPQGMGKTVLETETQSDISGATTSMDGLREAPADRPQFALNFLPLPIIHKDYHFTARQLATSRNGGSPLDTTMAELAGRRVAEEVERLLLGVAASFTFGGGTIYGYTNFPSRLTKTITSPNATGYAATTTVTEVLQMRDQLTTALHFGPYILYVSKSWDITLDDDFKAESDITLRERILRIGDIEDVRTLDFLTGFDMVMVQMQTDTVRLVVGMEMTTVQWETDGGLLQKFKVMTIMVPQLRADHNTNTGILHASV